MDTELATWIGAIGSTIGGLSTLVLAVVAARAGASWKKQIAQHRQQNVADELLVQAKLAVDVIKLMRYPYPQKGERERMPKIPGESDDYWEIRKSRQWPEVTYRENAEVFEQLRVTAVRAGAFLGEDYKNTAQFLLKVGDDALDAGRNMFNFLKQVSVSDGSELNEQQKKERQAIYSRIEGVQWSDFELSREVDEKYQTLVTLCEAKLREFTR